MLSGVKLVDRSEAERLVRAERKSKHKEKRKKHKKEKHKKQVNRRGSPSDSDRSRSPSRSEGGGSSGGEDDAWQRQLGDADDDSGQRQGGGTEPEVGRPTREDWMTVPMARSQLAQEPAKAPEPELPRPDPDAIKVSDKELNPYFKNGGSGLPTEDGAAGAAARRPVGVGDGGASWRMKALKRAQAQAQAEGKALNEVVGDRWGSLAELSSGLTERRAAPAMAHLHAARSRRGREEGEAGGNRGKGGEGREERAGYLEDVRSAKSQMMRPKAPESLSWRRDRGIGRDRDREPGRSRGEEQREERGERGRSAERDGEREHRDRGGDGREGEEGRGRDGRREEHRQQRSPDRRRGQSRERGRERGGDRSPGARHSRPGIGGGSGGDRGGGGRRAYDPLGRGENAELLRAAAAGMNSFADDGSFMERFAAQQAQQAGAQEGGRTAGEEQLEWGGREGGEGREVVSSPSTSGLSGEEGLEEGRGPTGSSYPPRQQQQQQQQRLPAAAAAAPKVLPAGGGGGGSGGGGGGTAGNRSAAALLKARLQGKAPPPEAEAGEPSGGRKEKEVVVLPMVDAQGKAVAGAFGREAAGAAAEPGRRPKRVERYEGGEKARYYKDDDVDLQTLVKRTKYEGVADLDTNLAQNIMRKARFKERDLDADAEYDHDAGLELAESRSKRGDAKQQQAREKQRQIRDYKRLTSALDQCTRCFASAARPKHLTVSIGQSTYLALPERGRLVPGHCCIIPTEHIASSRQVDEATWTEMRNFKKCLIQMFMKQGQEVVFLETALALGNMRSHAVVECIPVPAEAAAKAPMYFKKAVDDATSDWAQHHAKRFIDTKAKGLRGSIPPNFPYLNVEFGISGGFVHVIDDESKFDRSLGRNVMIGLLGLPQEDMHRRARQESVAIQTQWAAEFKRAFEPYDWTRMLD